MIELRNVGKYEFMRIHLIAVLIALSIGLEAQEYTSGKYHTGPDGLMLGGYDPVSYHQEKPLKGIKSLSHTHDGVTYWFANAENRELFKDDPEPYIPAFGGFCAFGLGMVPEKVQGFPPGRYKSSPDAYKLIDGKLYLFYPTNEWPALTMWNKDEANYLERAKVKWEEIRDH